jgi:DNA-binding MarR family transcriptional regulator
MTDEKEHARQVDQFVLDEIDSVPHLEALLLLWSNQPKVWSASEMGKALYVDTAYAGQILKDLRQRNLASEKAELAERFFYDATISEERNKLVQALDATYRREIIRISRMIHAKGSPAVREFAKAFRFTKDREE